MAKKTWDKAIHAAPTIDHRLTQDDWHKLNRTTVVADPDADPEVRQYNPSGPFYRPPSPLMTAPPEPTTLPVEPKKEVK